MSVTSLSEALVKASDEMAGPSNVSAAGRVYGDLRSRIVSLDLKPGETLSRAEIAKESGVSQSPLREAIQMLEQEGLVVSFPQSKTMVTMIDVDHARETQFLRLGVELEVTKTLARTNDAEILLPTSRILRMQKMAGEDKDIAEFNALDRLFHLSLFQAAGMSGLWHLISGRSGHIDRLRRLNLPDPGKISAVLNLHERIVAAISAGDVDEVDALVREHLSGTLASLPAIIQTHPEYFDDGARVDA